VKTLREEVYTSNHASLKQLTTIFDNEIENMQRLYIQIALEPSVKNWISHSYYNFSDEVQDGYQITNILRNYQLGSNNFFYIYSKKAERIITSGAVYPVRFFYDTYYQNHYDITFEEWQSLLEEAPSREFVQIKGEIPCSLLFTQNLPLENRLNSDGCIVIHYNNKMMNNLVSSIEGEQQGSFSILDDKGEYVLRSQSWIDPDWDLLFTEGDGVFNKDNHAIFMFQQSEIMNWKYVFSMQDKVFSKKIIHLQSIIFVSLFLSMMVGLLASIMLSRRNYSPIRKLILQLNGGQAHCGDTKQNDFDLIGEIIQKNFNERQQMAKRLIDQKGVLQSQFLLMAMQGKLDYSQDIESQFSQYGINGSVLNYIFVFDIDFPVYFDEMDKQISTQQFSSCNPELLTQSFSRESEKIYFSMTEDSIAVLYCSDSEKSENNAIQQIYAYLEKHFRYCHVSCGMSTCFSTLDRIPSAYVQATDACSYKAVRGYDQIISYDSIKAICFAYSFPFEIKQELFQNLMEGAFAKAELILRSVFDKNLTPETASPNVLKCLHADIVSLIFKCFFEIGVGTIPAYENFLKRLEASSSASELLEESIDCFTIIFSLMEKKKKSHNYVLRDNICTYIEETCSDYNLSLQSIADHFSLTPGYLSAFFKEQKGLKLGDFLNMTRIEKAKILLCQNHELSINEVANLVGLGDNHALIRIFNKYEKITPGQFRIKCGKAEKEFCS
jgi:AraC-like DNA-binding protein